MKDPELTAEEREVASRIKLLILDVDGVLTDGGIIVGHTSDGRDVELKRFNSLDGMGLKLIKHCSIEVAIVSGRVSSATTYRAKELGIVECHQEASGIKLPIVEKLLKERSYGWESVCMIVDDLVDLSVVERAGLPVAVANAVPEVKSICKWITEVPGGHGAVREICEKLIKARGMWDEILNDYSSRKP